MYFEKQYFLKYVKEIDTSSKWDWDKCYGKLSSDDVYLYKVEKKDYTYMQWKKE